jgi:hypothetical protein
MIITKLQLRHIFFIMALLRRPRSLGLLGFHWTEVLFQHHSSDTFDLLLPAGLRARSLDVSRTFQHLAGGERSCSCGFSTSFFQMTLLWRSRSLDFWVFIGHGSDLNIRNRDGLLRWKIHKGRKTLTCGLEYHSTRLSNLIYTTPSVSFFQVPASFLEQFRHASIKDLARSILIGAEEML